MANAQKIIPNLWFNHNAKEAVDYYMSVFPDSRIQHVEYYPENEQCGWCKDQFGLSWQVVPEDMGTLMQAPGAFGRMMEMKKLVISELAGKA